MTMLNDDHDDSYTVYNQKIYIYLFFRSKQQQKQQTTAKKGMFENSLFFNF